MQIERGSSAVQVDCMKKEPHLMPPESAHFPQESSWLGGGRLAIVRVEATYVRSGSL